MSSTGTRPVRTVQSRSNEALIEADKELINSLKIFSEASNFVAGLTGTPAQNSPKTPAGNYLAREGDSMIGPLALGPPLDFSIDVDANNTIDIGPLSDNAQFTSNVQLDDLQPNSSVLDIIDNANFDGQILILRTFAPTVPYTISQGTLGNGGNIQTGDSSDLTVGDLQTVTFIFDESLKIEANTGGSWRVLSVSSGGGGGLSEPVILTINTITPQTLPTTSVIDWSNNPNQITLDRDVEFSFSNLPASGSYEGVLVIIDVDGTGGYAAPVWPASLTNPPIVPTSANTRTSVMLYTIDGGTIVTHATSVGSTSSGFSGNWSDVTINTNKDMLTFNLNNLSSIASTDVATAASGFVLMGNGEFVAWRNAGNTADLSLTVNSSDRFQFTGGPLVTDTDLGNSVGNVALRWNTFFGQTVDLSTGSGALLGATIGSTNTLVGTLVATTDLAYTAGLKQTFSPDLSTNAGLNVGSIAGDPTTVADGDIWYSTTASNFRFRENGATVELGATPSSIIDGNTSFTANGTPDTLTGTFNGDADQLLIFGQGTAQYQSQATNYLTTYFRNDTTGVGGNFIQLAIHRGVDDQGTGAIFNYYQTISSILDPTNGSEDGKWLEAIGAKGSEVTAYTLEGSQGLVNTNVLHSFFGSMILTSNQDGDDAILRLTRNDTTPSDDNVIGVIQFHGEDSAGNDTQYGSISIESADVSNLSEDGRFAVDLINSVASLRMIEADALNNEIKFKPNADIDYTFDTTGLMLTNNTDVAIDTDFTPIGFERGITPLTYAEIAPQVKESTDAGRLVLRVRADNASLQDALIIEGADSSTNTFMTVNSRINSNLVFGVETGATDLKIFPQVNTIGISFDNVSYTVGSAGTFVFPFVTSLSATKEAADTAFGDHDGAAGILDTGSGALTLFVRQNDANWAGVTIARDVLT